MGRKIQRSLSRAGLALAAITFLASCGEPKPPAVSAGGAPGKPAVYTVNYPLTFFAERLAGDAADVVFLAPQDGDPAFWEPSDEIIAGFQSADLILRNGASYAKWAEKVSLPHATQVDTSKVFQGDYIKIEEATTHSHGASGEHAHMGTAFTTWMDLQQAIWQAEEIRDALIKILPEQQSTIEANFENLADELDALHTDLKAIGEALGDQPLLASHPVYQYFARRYDLNVRSVHWEPETIPDEAAMAELQKITVDHSAKIMLWEGKPESASVAKLATFGIESVVVDPCGNRPGEGEDFLSVMRSNITNLKKAAGLE